MQKRIHQGLLSSTIRLTLSYLTVVMLLSIGFSAVFYHTSFKEVMSHVPPQGLLHEYRNASGQQIVDDKEIKQVFAERIAEGRQSLLMKLIIINALNLCIGALFCYYLARLSLRPLRESMMAQVQFVSNASHELRTPLTALQTMNEVALRDKKLSLTQAKHVLQQNIDEVAGLRKLADGLLRLAKYGVQPLALRETQVQEIIADAVNQVLKAAQAKNIIIDTQVNDMVIRADKDSLSIALAAILDNAIKYSQSNSTVRVRSVKKGNEAHIIVSDSGIGIAGADLPHIFERFYRADESRSKQDSVNGYGIGLSIVQKIVEQHKGIISVQSSRGKGATFTLHLPRA